MSETDSRTERLNELAHEFVEYQRRDGHPTVEQFAAEHPDMADEIRELFPALLWMEQIDPLANCGDSRRSAPSDELPCPSQLGEYRVLRRIGHGGMGIVYEAMQESLGRHVALKVISRREARNAVVLERFKREAQAAAKLHHTNIVPVFGVGETDGIHYYAMQFIHGQSLDRVLADAVANQHPPSSAILGVADGDYYRAVARIGAQAADALAYAHSEGVLHRDVKPANLLLDLDGTVWITDFGLARIEGLSELTRAEDVIGTLRYVPPERFEGRTDSRGDIYSLGLTLYELLARQPAFTSESHAELVRRILHVPPRAPRGIDRRIPRDLETVVLKALAREPGRRYQTAAEMADDLRCFCLGHAVLARRLSVAEGAWRWCRQNPSLAFASSLAALLLLAMSVTSTFAYFRERGLRDSLQATLRRAQDSETQGRNELFKSYIATAKAAQLSRRPGQRFESLAAIRNATGLLPELGISTAELEKRRDELRDLAISCLTLPDIRDLGDLPANVILDWYHLDRFAQRDKAATLIVRQWPVGPELARLPNVSEHISFNFSPEQDSLVLIDQKAYTILRWPFRDKTPTRVAQLQTQEGELRQVVFSRDQRRVLIVHQLNDRGLIEVLDWPSGRHCLSREFPYQRGFTLVRLSPDGRQVAAIDGRYGTEGSRRVRVTDVDEGGDSATLVHKASVQSIAWHPDSQTLAAGLTDSNDIVLWNVPKQKQLGTLTDQRGGGPLLCSGSTGELLSSWSSWTKNVALFHPYSRKLLLQTVSGVQFEFGLRDGRMLGNIRLASGDWHYAVAEPSPVLRTLARNPVYGPVTGWRDVSVHRDGRLLAVGSDNGVSLFDLETGQDVGRLPVGYALHPWFIPETGDLLTYSEQGLLRWPVSFGESKRLELTIGPPETLPCPAVYGTEVASDRTGRVIAAAAGKKAIILHDFGQRVITLDSLSDCRKIAVSPNGRWVVTANHDGGPKDIWDSDSGARVHQRSDNIGESHIAFSPDSRRLSFERCSPRVIRTETWQEEPLQDAPSVGLSCFSPDGKLAIELRPAAAILRDALTGRKLGMLSLPDPSNAWHATFTPDGMLAILSSNDQSVAYVWDLCRLSHELSELQLNWESPSFAASFPAKPTPSPAAPIQVHIVPK